MKRTEMRWNEIKKNELKWNDKSSVFVVFDRSIRRRFTWMLAARPGGAFACSATEKSGVRQCGTYAQKDKVWPQCNTMWSRLNPPMPGPKPRSPKWGSGREYCQCNRIRSSLWQSLCPQDEWKDNVWKKKFDSVWLSVQNCCVRLNHFYWQSSETSVFFGTPTKVHWRIMVQHTFLQKLMNSPAAQHRMEHVHFCADTVTHTIFAADVKSDKIYIYIYIYIFIFIYLYNIYYYTSRRPTVGR